MQQGGSDMADETTISIPKNSKKLRELNESQRDYVLHFLENNRHTFAMCMKRLESSNPTTWVKVYMSMSKMVTPKETNMNVTVGLSKDMMELKALANTGLNGKAMQAIEDKGSDALPDFTEYEEIARLGNEKKEYNDGARDFELPEGFDDGTE